MTTKKFFSQIPILLKITITTLIVLFLINFFQLFATEAVFSSDQKIVDVYLVIIFVPLPPPKFVYPSLVPFPNGIHAIPFEKVCRVPDMINLGIYPVLPENMFVRFILPN